MANTFSQLYFHVVWSTKDRKNLISKTFQDHLYKYMRGIINNEGGTLLEIGGIENHVHLLVQLPLTILIPELIRQIKSRSTKWIRETIPDQDTFTWQTGYGAFSVSRSMVDMVAQYLLNQEKHHQHHSFEDEYFALLKCHNIQFEQKYALG